MSFIKNNLILTPQKQNFQQNISAQTNEKTARTCLSCAEQRAENLSLLGVSSVLELCVGPSLKELENQYKKHGINVVVGNDIDPRWKNYYNKGSWIIGDATTIPKQKIKSFDAVVVAPPLSKNCSGLREDSLSLDAVQPPYTAFTTLQNNVVVFVLPGRTLSIKEDRRQFYAFLSKLESPTRKISVVPLKQKKTTKYIDVYWEKIKS